MAKTVSKKDNAKKSAPKTAPTKQATATVKSKPQSDSISIKSPSRTITHGERQRMIAEAAYLRALSRNFMNGSEIDDWVAAETEINKKLSGYKVI